MNKTIERIPTWALCYIIDGNAKFLTDNEVLMIDNWYREWEIQSVSPVTDEEGNTHTYFSQFPLFLGIMPTEVMECEIIYNNDNI